MKRPLASNTHELGLRGFGVYSSFEDCRRVGALDCLLIVCPFSRGNLSAQLHSPDCGRVWQCLLAKNGGKRTYFFLKLIIEKYIAIFSSTF